MIDSVPAIPEHIADLARAAYWIEALAMNVESHMGPDDSWIRATTATGVTGRWRFGSIVEAVQATVGNCLRDWKEYDHLIFRPSL